MVIRENNETKKAKITNIDSLLDIQWWLYKSILARRPMHTKIYKDWFNIYKMSYELVSKIESDNIAYYEAAKEYKTIISKLKLAQKDLDGKISRDYKESLNIIIDKLISGINNIICILEDKNDE